MESALMQQMIGPAGTLITLIVILGWIARVTQKQLIPACQAFVDRHLGQVDALIASHDADRRAWTAELAAIRADMGEGFAQVRSDVAAVRTTPKESVS